MTDLHDMAERIAEKHELEELRAEVKRLRRELAAEKLRNAPPWMDSRAPHLRELRREAGEPEFNELQYWAARANHEQYANGIGPLGNLIAGLFGRSF